MVSESSFSHGVTLDALDDAGKLITIENLDSFTVIYERKKGNYHQLPQEWCRFIEKYEYLATEKTLSMFWLKFVSMALFFDKSFPCGAVPGCL